MFKNCKNLFDLSRKLGSVVTGLGLAGVLFSGQVSAAPPRKTANWYNLAEQDERYARIYTPVSWRNLARQGQDFRSNYDPSARRWRNLARPDESYARIYTPRAVPSTPWTDGEIEYLANVVAGFVNSGRDINWGTVAEQLNRLTDGSRTPHACRLKWIQLTQE